MGGAIVQDEGHGLHLAAKGFGNDDLLEKGLEIDKALARSASAVDLSISDGESGKQMASAAPMIAGFLPRRLVRECWARRLLRLTLLHRRFLIRSNQPSECWPKR